MLDSTTTPKTIVYWIRSRTFISNTQTPDSTSRGSWVTSPSHALPSLPNMRVNPRTFLQIPCTIPKILCYPIYLLAWLPLSRQTNSSLCAQRLHKLQARNTQLFYHQNHLSPSAYPRYGPCSIKWHWWDRTGQEVGSVVRVNVWVMNIFVKSRSIGSDKSYMPADYNDREV